jgi:GT2 family glycosyltransferase
MGPAVSVIIPVKRAGPLLAGCLAHLAAQTYRDFDVYVVPDDATPIDGVRVIASGPVLPNRKRQIAAGATTAPILAFIDDDAYAAPDWLAAAVRHFDDPGVVAAGGPSVTPPEAHPRERASGAIFASPLVSASTRERYVPGRRTHDVDGLPSCNLLIRRDAFLRDAGATVDCWPGEDMLTCWFARRDGGRIVYDPAVRVFHHRRPLFAAHLRQVWRYAIVRGDFMRRYDRSRRTATYAAPAAFVIAHPFVGALAARPRTRRIATILVAAYVALVAASARREARAARANAPLVAAGIYLTHLTYGVGSIVGFVRGERERAR